MPKSGMGSQPPDGKPPVDFPLSAVIGSLAEGVWAIDPDGRTTYVNPALATLLGYTPAEMAGRELAAFLDEDEAGRAREDLVRSRQGDPRRLELRLLRKDGVPVDAAFAFAPVRDASGALRGAAAVVMDLTERTRLAKEMEWLARFPAESPSPILRVSRDGLLLYANPASAFLLDAWGIRTGGVLPSALRRLVEIVYSEGAPRILELDVRGRFFSLLIAPFSREGYLNIYGRDVTEQHRIGEQLRQVQKMEAVGQLAGGIAHDFNNMLFVINGRAELELRRLGPDDPGRPALELIRKTGDRAAILTRQLLAFSRRQVLQPRALDLNATVSDMLKMLRRLIREDIALVTDLAPDPGPILADPGQVEQVILNLAVNARDAMPGGGTLTLRTARIDLDESFAKNRPYQVRTGPYVLLAVSDNGIGMDDHVKAHLFEPFFTTKEPGQGTGLGLATVYGVVKQSGGYIEIRSEPKRGTTVEVYFPPAEGEGSSRTMAAAALCRGSETVLLVEDVDSVRELVRDMLADCGYTVLDASDGARALELAERHPGPIHLLLTDVVMPVMGGPELARRLALARPGLKVVYMSGYADQAAGTDLASLGARFLQKPIQAGVLSYTVRNALDGGPP
jgi:PAS domain S-box-containing protein